MAEWLKDGGKAHGPVAPVIERAAAQTGYSTRQKSSLIKIAGELVGAFAETSLGSPDNVFECEWPVQFRMDRALFNGIVDRVDKTDAGFRIIDYKLATKHEKYHYQIRFYAWMLGHSEGVDIDDGMICYMKAPGDPDVVDLGDESIARIEADARGLEDAMSMGCFDAAPNAPCGSCRFKGVCPEVKSAKSAV